MDRLDVAGGQLEYQWVGLGDGGRRTLVFLHEGLGCVRLWGRFPHTLAAMLGCRGLVFSRFGYGDSGPLPRPRTSRFLHEEALDVLPAVLDGLGVQAPVLVGQSDGASIALIYASAHPVAALILETPHVFTEQLTLDGIAQTRERFRADAEFRAKFSRYHRDADALVAGWAGAWLDPSFRTWNIEEVLPAIACPVLLLQAERDPYGSLEHVDRIERQVAGPTRRVILPGSSHAPHRDCHARTLHEMTEFVESLAIA